MKATFAIVILLLAGISTAFAADNNKDAVIVVSGGTIDKGKAVLWIVHGTSVTQCTYVDGTGAPGCTTKENAFK